MSHPYLNQLTWRREERAGLDHLWLERLDGKPIRCGWDTLQTILHELSDPDTTWIEFFPSADRVVNETNRRHFWHYGGFTPPLKPYRY